MSIFSKLFTKKELIEEVGVCPNCWGEQKYDDKVRTMAKDKQVDVNNHEKRHAFIQDFVVNQVDGIRLSKEGDKFRCPKCNSIHAI